MKTFYVRLANYDVEPEALYSLIEEFKYFEGRDDMTVYQLDNWRLKAALTRRFVKCVEMLYPAYNDAGCSPLNSLKKHIEVHNLLFSSVILVDDSDESIVHDFISQDGLCTIDACPTHVKCPNAAVEDNDVSVIFKINIKKYTPLHSLYNKEVEYVPYYKIDSDQADYYKVRHSLLIAIRAKQADCDDISNIKATVQDCLAELKAINTKCKTSARLSGFQEMCFMMGLVIFLYIVYLCIEKLISVYF